MLSIKLSLETENIPHQSTKRGAKQTLFFAVTGFQFKIGEKWYRGESELVGLEKPEAQADAQALAAKEWFHLMIHGIPQAQEGGSAARVTNE